MVVRPISVVAALLPWLLLACGPAVPPPTGSALPEETSAVLPPLPALASTVADRNPQKCIAPERARNFAFQDQITVQEARGFSVRYDGNVKWLTVRRGSLEMHYALVQCGTKIPSELGGAIVIEVPIRHFVTTSTTELPAVVMLDAAEGLLGHSTLRYVSSPEIRRRIDSGAVFEAGVGGGLDVERVIAAGPDVLFADTYGDAEFGGGDELDALSAAGIGVVAVPSYLETTPLGRAEWLVFVGLFLNREARAADLFEQVAERYRQLAAAGRAVVDRPIAITGGPMGDVWHVPGGRSYMARMLADAGLSYPWADDPSVGSLALAFEAAWHRARQADLWVRPSRWRSIEEIVRADQRLTTVPAVNRGDVVVADLRLVEGGGNDFWESGNARPDLVLADLLVLAHPAVTRPAGAQPVLAHPALADGHQLVYLRRLGAVSEPAGE